MSFGTSRTVDVASEDAMLQEKAQCCTRRCDVASDVAREGAMFARENAMLQVRIAMQRDFLRLRSYVLANAYMKIFFLLEITVIIQW